MSTKKNISGTLESNFAIGSSSAVRLIDEKNYINGFNLIWLTNSTLCICDGVALSSDNTVLLDNTGAIDIDITEEGLNGLDTGSEAANTWYYIYVIKNTNINACSGLFSLSPTGPTMPSGYTKKRRVGIWRNNDSSNLLNATQNGKNNTRQYAYNLQQSDCRVLSAGSATETTSVDCIAYVPPTSTFFNFFVQIDSDTYSARIRNNTLIKSYFYAKSGGEVKYKNYSSSFTYEGVSSPANVYVDIMGFEEEI